MVDKASPVVCLLVLKPEKVQQPKCCSCCEAETCQVSGWEALYPGVCKSKCSHFFSWNVKTWENTFSAHLPKVGEWKQDGMNAGPQRAVSGMCWREPDPRPNPHSQTEAHACKQKSACSCKKIAVAAQNSKKNFFFFWYSVTRHKPGGFQHWPHCCAPLHLTWR